VGTNFTKRGGEVLGLEWARATCNDALVGFLYPVTDEKKAQAGGRPHSDGINRFQGQRRESRGIFVC